MPQSRRQFLKSAAAVSLGFVGLQRHVAHAVDANSDGFGSLKPDPAGLLDLPAHLSYRVLGRTGEKMSDGLLVPGAPDAMGRKESAR